ncbi:GNAT family N-acetyltransferase [Enterococcus crotali]|uniref:GNAT family N-acetyltransferase n=1 Tax=Enterococcus crotali TaxID=1453587 RepID=UPI00047217F0|nr:GNAT family protein [Enterococcus crotali]
MNAQPNYNSYDQPIGFPISDWSTREYPSKNTLEGMYCRLEKIDPNSHFEALYQVYGPESKAKNWTYLPLYPFESKADFSSYLETISGSKDPFHYAIIDKASGKALGTLALMRINADHGSIEVGFVIYADTLKKTRIATEAQYLLACYAMDDLGYRRYEWKCDALNEPSRNAALRLGFRFEGIFRNALVYKGRNRDTAWFSIIDSEWQQVKIQLESWLAPTNFTAEGEQKRRLHEF